MAIIRPNRSVILKEAALRALQQGEVAPGLPLKPSQKGMLEGFYRHIDQTTDIFEQRHSYADSATGSGKNGSIVLIAAHAHKIAQERGMGDSFKTFIGEPSIPMLLQMRREFSKFAPDILNSIGMYGGDHRELNKPITIITHDSRQLLLENGLLRTDDIDLSIDDEAHMGSLSIRRQNIINQILTDTYHVGFTASAEYDADKTMTLTHRNRFYHLPLREAVEAGILADYVQVQYAVVRMLPEEMQHLHDVEGPNIDFTFLRRQEWSHLVTQAYRDGRDDVSGQQLSDKIALFFAADTTHADNLAAMLNHDPILQQKARERGFKGVAVSIHTRGISDTEQVRRQQEFEAGEYMAAVGDKKFKTGFDHPAIKFAATFPGSSLVDVIQEGGRATRHYLNPITGESEGATILETILYVGDSDPEKDLIAKRNAFKNIITMRSVLGGTLVLKQGRPPAKEVISPTPKGPRILSRGSSFELFTTEEETLTISTQIEKAGQNNRIPLTPSMLEALREKIRQRGEYGAFALAQIVEKFEQTNNLVSVGVRTPILAGLLHRKPESIEESQWLRIHEVVDTLEPIEPKPRIPLTDEMLDKVKSDIAAKGHYTVVEVLKNIQDFETQHGLEPSGISKSWLAHVLWNRAPKEVEIPSWNRLTQVVDVLEDKMRGVRIDLTPEMLQDFRQKVSERGNYKLKRLVRETAEYEVANKLSPITVGGILGPLLYGFKDGVELKTIFKTTWDRLNAVVDNLPVGGRNPQTQITDQIRSDIKELIIKKGDFSSYRLAEEIKKFETLHGLKTLEVKPSAIDQWLNRGYPNANTAAWTRFTLTLNDLPDVDAGPIVVLSQNSLRDIAAKIKERWGIRTSGFFSKMIDFEKENNLPPTGLAEQDFLKIFAGSRRSIYQAQLDRILQVIENTTPQTRIDFTPEMVASINKRVQELGGHGSITLMRGIKHFEAENDLESVGLTDDTLRLMLNGSLQTVNEAHLNRLWQVLNAPQKSIRLRRKIKGERLEFTAAMHTDLMARIAAIGGYGSYVLMQKVRAFEAEHGLEPVGLNDNRVEGIIKTRVESVVPDQWNRLNEVINSLLEAQTVADKENPTSALMPSEANQSDDKDIEPKAANTEDGSTAIISHTESVDDIIKRVTAEVLKQLGGTTLPTSIIEKLAADALSALHMPTSQPQADTEKDTSSDLRAEPELPQSGTELPDASKEPSAPNETTTAKTDQQNRRPSKSESPHDDEAAKPAADRNNEVPEQDAAAAVTPKRKPRSKAEKPASGDIAEAGTEPTVVVTTSPAVTAVGNPIGAFTAHLSHRLQQYVGEELGEFSALREKAWETQLECYASIASALKTETETRRFLITSATGTGKTNVFWTVCALAFDELEANKKKIFILTPTNPLVKQTYDRAKSIAPHLWFNEQNALKNKIGKLNMYFKDHDKSVVITTPPSFLAALASGAIQPSEVGLLILDEAHSTAMSEMRERAIRELPNALTFAFTATPEYSQEKSLIKMGYKEVYRLTVEQAVERKVIAPFANLVLRTDVADLEKVSVSKGGYDASAMGRAINRLARNKVGLNFYKNHIDEATGIPMLGQIGFINCSDVDHANKVAELFNEDAKKNPDDWKDITASGITIAAAIHSDVSRTERERILQDHQEGKILLVVGVDMIATGIDNVEATLCLNLAPTLSQVFAAQRGGRVLRTDPLHPDKFSWIVDVVDTKGPKAKPVLFSEAIGITPRAANNWYRTAQSRKRPASGEDRQKRIKVENLDYNIVSDAFVVSEMAESFRLQRQNILDKPPHKSEDDLTARDVLIELRKSPTYYPQHYSKIRNIMLDLEKAQEDGIAELHTSDGQVYSLHCYWRMAGLRKTFCLHKEDTSVLMDYLNHSRALLDGDDDCLELQDFQEEFRSKSNSISRLFTDLHKQFKQNQIARLPQTGVVVPVKIELRGDRYQLVIPRAYVEKVSKEIKISGQDAPDNYLTATDILQETGINSTRLQPLIKKLEQDYLADKSTLPESEEPAQVGYFRSKSGQTFFFVHRDHVSWIKDQLSGQKLLADWQVENLQKNNRFGLTSLNRYPFMKTKLPHILAALKERGITNRSQLLQEVGRRSTFTTGLALVVTRFLNGQNIIDRKSGQAVLTTIARNIADIVNIPAEEAYAGIVPEDVSIPTSEHQEKADEVTTSTPSGESIYDVPVDPSSLYRGSNHKTAIYEQLDAEYMRQVRAVEPLPHEELIETAKQLMTGRANLISALLSSPLTLTAIHKLYQEAATSPSSSRDIIQVTSVEHMNAEDLDDNPDAIDDEDINEGPLHANTSEVSAEIMGRAAVISTACAELIAIQREHYQRQETGKDITASEIASYRTRQSQLFDSIMKTRPRDKHIVDLNTALGSLTAVGSDALKLAQKAKIDRDIFLKAYMGHELDGQWGNLLTATGLVSQDEVSHVQRSLAELSRKAGLPFRSYVAVLKDALQSRRVIEKAKQKMTETNLRLVIKIANKYRNRGLSLPDMVQEGNIGLMTAVEQFDHRYGFRFSTPATNWIKQHILRAITDFSNTIRIPVHLREALAKLRKAAHELADEKGRNPTIRELADRLGFPPEKVRHIINLPREPNSLDAPVGDDDDGDSFGSFIGDTRAANPLENLDKDKLQKRIAAALAEFPLKEAEIIRLRFGIGTDAPMTLEEISPLYNVTRERIRQIEAKALDRFRFRAKKLKLSQFLEERPVVRRGAETDEDGSTSDKPVYKRENVIGAKLDATIRPSRSRLLDQIPFLNTAMPELLQALQAKGIHTTAELANALAGGEQSKVGSAYGQIADFLKNKITNSYGFTSHARLIAVVAGLQPEVAYANIERPVLPLQKKQAVRTEPRQNKDHTEDSSPSDPALRRPTPIDQDTIQEKQTDAEPELPTASESNEGKAKTDTQQTSKRKKAAVKLKPDSTANEAKKIGRKSQSLSDISDIAAEFPELLQALNTVGIYNRSQLAEAIVAYGSTKQNAHVLVSDFIKGTIFDARKKALTLTAAAKLVAQAAQLPPETAYARQIQARTLIEDKPVENKPEQTVEPRKPKRYKLQTLDGVRKELAKRPQASKPLENYPFMTDEVSVLLGGLQAAGIETDEQLIQAFAQSGMRPALVKRAVGRFVVGKIFNDERKRFELTHAAQLAAKIARLPEMVAYEKQFRLGVDLPEDAQKRLKHRLLRLANRQDEAALRPILKPVEPTGAPAENITRPEPVVHDEQAAETTTIIAAEEDKTAQTIETFNSASNEIANVAAEESSLPAETTPSTDTAIDGVELEHNQIIDADFEDQVFEASYQEASPDLHSFAFLKQNIPELLTALGNKGFTTKADLLNAVIATNFNSPKLCTQLVEAFLDGKVMTARRQTEPALTATSKLIAKIAGISETVAYKAFIDVGASETAPDTNPKADQLHDFKLAATASLTNMPPEETAGSTDPASTDIAAATNPDFYFRNAAELHTQLDEEDDTSLAAPQDDLRKTIIEGLLTAPITTSALNEQYIQLIQNHSKLSQIAGDQVTPAQVLKRVYDIVETLDDYMALQRKEVELLEKNLPVYFSQQASLIQMRTAITAQIFELCPSDRILGETVLHLGDITQIQDKLGKRQRRWEKTTIGLDDYQDVDHGKVQEMRQLNSAKYELAKRVGVPGDELVALTVKLKKARKQLLRMQQGITFSATQQNLTHRASTHTPETPAVDATSATEHQSIILPTEDIAAIAYRRLSNKADLALLSNKVGSLYDEVSNGGSDQKKTNGFMALHEKLQQIRQIAHHQPEYVDRAAFHPLLEVLMRLDKPHRRIAADLLRTMDGLVDAATSLLQGWSYAAERMAALTSGKGIGQHQDIANFASEKFVRWTELANPRQTSQYLGKITPSKKEIS